MESPIFSSLSDLTEYVGPSQYRVGREIKEFVRSVMTKVLSSNQM